MASFPCFLSLIILLFATAASRAAEPAPLPKGGFTLMTYNVWKSWSQVDRGYEKGIESIRKSGADVVCFQESSDALATQVASDLGWNRAASGQGSVQIVSRYPITETFRAGIAAGAKIRVSLPDGVAKDIIVFNCHLDFQFYGPYAAHIPGATTESVLAEENKSKRAGQMTTTAAAMEAWLAKADETPVFLTGDFNGPSHLDWTAARAGDHGGVADLQWPVTITLQKVGMVDSFRALHPDAAKEPGTTWSTIHKESEPQDRIDFIFYKGRSAAPIQSKVWTTPVENTIGTWGSPLGEVPKNTWPSDHAAVVTVFRLL